MEDDTLITKYFDEVTKYMQNNGEVEERSEEFQKLTTDLERIAYVIKQPSVEKTITIPESDVSWGKSSSLAVKYRLEGNKKFQAKNYTGALELYNLCIRVAPIDVQQQAGQTTNNDLTLAYANRSAALFHLNNFKLSLPDVKRAFANKYPQNLHYKLYDREARCLVHLKQFESAITAYKNAKNALPMSDIDASKRTFWEKQFSKGLQSCKEFGCKYNTESEVVSAKDQLVLPSVHKSVHHSKFTSLSSACDVRYTEEQGRYIVAEEDLGPGDVVLVEKPFASVLMPDHYTDHCDHCLVRLTAGISCSVCSLVIFCGEQCKEQAISSYHKYECSILQAVHNSGVGKFSHLALRTVTCKPLQYFTDFRQKLKENQSTEPKLQGTNCDQKYSSQDYTTIYNLVGHSDQRNPNDLFMRTITAVFLLKCLQKTTYFKAEKSQNCNVNEELTIFIGSLILSHLQSFPCNAHEISELILDKTEVATSVCQEIGAGIYATLSLFNHSCDPAATRHFYGDSCVVRTLRPISLGEEISDNYGAVFAVQDKSERQSRLKPQYYFECGCIACTNDWPLYSSITFENPVYLCNQCKKPLSISVENVRCITCNKCHAENNLQVIMKTVESSTEKYYSGLGSLLECNFTAAMSNLTDAMTGIYSHVEKPWRDVNNIQEALKQCFNSMGNCVVVKEKP